jgi:hypothetical protein
MIEYAKMLFLSLTSYRLHLPRRRLLAAPGCKLVRTNPARMGLLGFRRQ